MFNKKSLLIFDFLRPNIPKLVVFLLFVVLSIYFLSSSTALGEIEGASGGVYDDLITILFVWPLFSFGNNLILNLVLNVIYIYILSCVFSSFIYWLKAKLKRKAYEEAKK